MDRQALIQLEEWMEDRYQKGRRSRDKELRKIIRSLRRHHHGGISFDARLVESEIADRLEKLLED